MQKRRSPVIKPEDTGPVPASAFLAKLGGSLEAPLERRNQAPIVLLGGFTVWGREEALGFKYWGGLRRDIQEDLKRHGFETVTAAVGPFASNWDRACEAYAILKGGRVDYGKAHSERHGHARYGRTYRGLLPSWGESGSVGSLPSKIHLLAHSQGGQTARLLVQLLVKGDEAERKTTIPDELSPLFCGDHDWVISVTTLTTPHDGTSLVFHREGLIGPAQKLLTVVTSFAKPRNHLLYDFKLDQWGVRKRERESRSSFMKRVFQSPLWKGTRDFSAWDLSPEGASELNAWVKAQPNVYYFSWSASKTQLDGKGHHVCSPRMMPLWLRGGRFMGRTRRSEPGQVLIDETWFPNDGVVNTRSMPGPSTDPIQPFDGKPRKGRWNHMGVLEGWDHGEILGIGFEHGDEVLDFYQQWAAFLASLEA